MFSFATIQTGPHWFEERFVIAPRLEDGTVLLDACPAGTMSVRTFPNAKAAAAAKGVSLSTIYRWRREAEATEAEMEECYV